MTDCQVCSNKLGCSNCPTSYHSNLGNVGIAPIIVAAIITAIAGAGAAVYTVSEQKRAAKKQRAWAEEQNRLAEQELAQSMLSQSMLSQQPSAGLPDLLGGIPKDYLILGGIFFAMMMTIMMLK